MGYIRTHFCKIFHFLTCKNLGVKFGAKTELVKIPGKNLGNVQVVARIPQPRTSRVSRKIEARMQAGGVGMGKAAGEGFCLLQILFDFPPARRGVKVMISECIVPDGLGAVVSSERLSDHLAGKVAGAPSLNRAAPLRSSCREI